MITRLEHDSMGAMDVPTNTLYVARTQRAVLNFPICGQPLPARFIRALLLIKASAPEANAALGTISGPGAQAIGAACEALLGGSDEALMRHFPVDVFQTGSDTSTHMNANEVIASLAARTLQQRVDPNDPVNASQSSNDVMPSALHVAAARAQRDDLLPALAHLTTTLETKAQVQAALARNPVPVTALNPVIGDAKAAEIAKQACREGRSILDVAEACTDLPREELARLLDPARLSGPS